MLLRTGFIEPCLPSPAERPPVGPAWVREIKHDGFRLMARRDAAGVRLFTRNGHEWTRRFPLVAEALGALRLRSSLIDGEAIACRSCRRGTGCGQSACSPPFWSNEDRE